MDQEQLIAWAMGLVILDTGGQNLTAAQTTAALVEQHGISPARAATVTATAARRLRNQQLVNDPGLKTYTFRDRFTERQRERLQLMAEQETNGNMSALVRKRLFE